MAPDFLIIGAAKSGTTSLSHYVGQHRDVFMAREKESHFLLFEGQEPTFRGPGDQREFNPLIVTDATRYEQMFAPGAPARTRGEASVYYLYQPQFAANALSRNPAMRFIAVLRNPVDRAFSAWGHMVRDGREEADFETAYRLDRAPVRQGWSWGFEYQSVGMYGSQLARLYRTVPREQVLILLYDDLMSSPDKVLSTIFAFLGLEDASVDTSLVMNASGRPRSAGLNRLLTQSNPLKTSLKRVLPYEFANRSSERVRNWNLKRMPGRSDVKRALLDDYREDLDLLETQLGRSLDAWREDSHEILRSD